MQTTTTEQVWEAFSLELRRFIRSKVSHPDDADDVLQNVFIKVHLHLDTMKRNERLTAWLYQVARNAIYDFYRTNKRNVTATLDESIWIDETNEESESWSDALQQCIEHMVNDLPEQYREPIRMNEWQHKSQKQVAEELKLGYSAVKSRIQRGRDMLKDALKTCCALEINQHRQLVKGDWKMSQCEGLCSSFATAL